MISIYFGCKITQHICICHLQQCFHVFLPTISLQEWAGLLCRLCGGVELEMSQPGLPERPWCAGAARLPAGTPYKASNLDRILLLMRFLPWTAIIQNQIGWTSIKGLATACLKDLHPHIISQSVQTSLNILTATPQSFTRHLVHTTGKDDFILSN